ncbi:ferric-chelate reductase [Purpureocillium lavendulum]|uniref:ferric-chelate reductase (NADPH) n=1 Tax=Purpureocillium lavendulum TaxID=1247861 RepID=A0AB34FCK9_9HYPO|nr:ferric-chelate reductase [Purpureocillium lavendulum]
MSFFMAVFHVVAAYIGLVEFSLSDAKNLFGLIAILSLAFLCIPFPAVLKILPYELVLRLHQLAAGLLAYACWIHIPPRQRFFAYVCAGIFLTVLVAQITLVLVPNCLGLCRAQISSEYGLVKLQLSLKGQPIDVQAGKYVNVWIPGLNRWRSWSFLQSHPFTVASWSETPSRELELLIKPESGWTKLLLERTNRPWVLERWAFFSGPHGKVPKIDQYETILVLADQFKIISCMPFLREIVHVSNSSTKIKW